MQRDCVACGGKVELGTLGMLLYQEVMSILPTHDGTGSLRAFVLDVTVSRSDEHPPHP
jgi:hypothetical protein